MVFIGTPCNLTVYIMYNLASTKRCVILMVKRCIDHFFVVVGELRLLGHDLLEITTERILGLRILEIALDFRVATRRSS